MSPFFPWTSHFIRHPLGKNPDAPPIWLFLFLLFMSKIAPIPNLQPRLLDFLLCYRPSLLLVCRSVSSLCFVVNHYLCSLFSSPFFHLYFKTEDYLRSQIPSPFLALLHSTSRRLIGRENPLIPPAWLFLFFLYFKDFLVSQSAALFARLFVIL